MSATALRIGITCSSKVGGSSVVATEIANELARRGHGVHVITDQLPHRLDLSLPTLHFHAVETGFAPVITDATYGFALASTIVRVVREHKLDLVHAHYAVPFAAAAWVAGQILGNSAPRLITTLHGTDVTHVGPTPSFLPLTRHSLLHSDAVTTPSAYLRSAALRAFSIDSEQLSISVIPNFVDTEHFRPAAADANEHLTALFGAEAETTPVLVHVSNFRPVKQVARVVDVFARVHAERPAFLLLVGDGPDRAAVEQDLRRRGLSGRARTLGNQDHFQTLLRACSVFLLPSTHESFGLAALEALSSGVPVVASRVGGLSEVVRERKTGFLVPADDSIGMARRVREICDNPGLHARMRTEARIDVEERFRRAPVIDQYEALYRRILTGPSSRPIRPVHYSSAKGRGL